MSQIYNKIKNINNLDDIASLDDINDIININWILTDPLESTMIFDGDENDDHIKMQFIEDRKKLFKMKMPIEKNDRVCIFGDDTEITELILGDTVRDFLEAIERGLNRKPDCNNFNVRQYIYMYSFHVFVKPCE